MHTLNQEQKRRTKHALALYPYFGHSSATMSIFPPTSLEYIAASMKDLVGKVTLLDLQYDNPPKIRTRTKRCGIAGS
jgi:hypothetical protein